MEHLEMEHLEMEHLEMEHLEMEHLEMEHLRVIKKCQHKLKWNSESSVALACTVIGLAL